MPVRPAYGLYEAAPPSSQGLPVAFALAGLTLAVLFAIDLSGGSGPEKTRSRSAGHPAPAIAAADSRTVRVAPPDHRPAIARFAAGPTERPAHRYDGGGYSLAYPVGWRVATNDRPVANYAETQIETRDAAAKVTVDHTARELTDPAFKAAQVEAATSRTAGYRRLVFRPVMVGDRYAFEWVFTLAGATDPQRADIFVNTGHDGFAFLAHGADFGRALHAARAIAASVAVRG